MSVLSVAALDSALAGAPFLAAGQSTPPPAPASGQEFGSASTLGFVVLVLFFIAVAFLARSMAKHLKRVQKPFEEAAARAAAESENADTADSATAPPETPAAPSEAPNPAEHPKADA